MLGYYALEEGGGAAFDPDYQAVLDEGTTQGYTLPSPAQQILQNALMVDIKASGLFAKIDLFYVLANDGSKEFAKINWVAPTTFYLTEGATIGWTSNEGYKPTTNAGRLLTGYRPSVGGTHFVYQDSSYGFWFHDVGTGSDYLFGDFSRNLLRQSGATTRINAAGSTTITTPTNGYFSVSRDNGSNFDVDDSGTAANYTATSASVDDNDFDLLNRHNSNSASNATMSVFHCGAALVSDEARTPITDYMNAI